MFVLALFLLPLSDFHSTAILAGYVSACVKDITQIAAPNRVFLVSANFGQTDQTTHGWNSRLTVVNQMNIIKMLQEN